MARNSDTGVFLRQPKNFQVELTCGCRILLVDRPLNGKQKFVCPGTGHGYNLGWIGSTHLPTGAFFANRKA